MLSSLKIPFLTSLAGATGAYATNGLRAADDGAVAGFLVGMAGVCAYQISSWGWERLKEYRRERAALQREISSRDPEELAMPPPEYYGNVHYEDASRWPETPSMRSKKLGHYVFGIYLKRSMKHTAKPSSRLPNWKDILSGGGIINPPTPDSN